MVPGAPGQIGKQVQMKKRTKKALMELLDLWPMSIFVPLVLIILILGVMFQI
jgi:hypothetical protein